MIWIDEKDIRNIEKRLMTEIYKTGNRPWHFIAPEITTYLSSSSSSSKKFTDNMKNIPPSFTENYQEGFSINSHLQEVKYNE